MHTPLYKKQCKPILSKAERKFYSFLLSLMQGRAFSLFSKVRMVDVLDTTIDDVDVSFHDISKRHFDFVLCRNQDFMPICVIELNDSTHKTNFYSMESDRIKRMACRHADLPFFAVQCRREYNTESMKYLLNHAREQSLES